MLVDWFGLDSFSSNPAARHPLSCQQLKQTAKVRNIANQSKVNKIIERASEGVFLCQRVTIISHFIRFFCRSIITSANCNHQTIVGVSGLSVIAYARACVNVSV